MRTNLPRRLLPRRLLQAHFQRVPEPRVRLRAAPRLSFGASSHFAPGEIPTAGLRAAGSDLRQCQAGHGFRFEKKKSEKQRKGKNVKDT